MNWTLSTEVMAMLFHEIYGGYYSAAAAILREAVRGTLTERKMYELIRRNAFGESQLVIPDGMKGEKWKLIHGDLTTPMAEEPDMPLTIMEKRWMKALLLDPRIRLFDPDVTGLEDVEPLFTPDMLVYYDRYNNGDDYSDPGYIRNFRTIMQALRDGKDLNMTCLTKVGSIRKVTVSPYYLEYSEKDDRFRLIAGGKKRRLTFNLSRITGCEAVDHTGDRLPVRKPDTVSVTFELEDRRNALERVLLHFSHLEKETVRLEEDRYLVTLKYDRQDETEILIRILSFGPAIKVTEPESFIDLIRERIEKQKRFASFLP